MGSSKYFIKWILFFFLAAILFLSLFVIRISNSRTSSRQPVLSNVSSLASNGEDIYVLDAMFNNIGKYDVDGTFHWNIHFTSWGSSVIFCNENGELCRNDIREDTTYVYDDTGALISSYPESIRSVIAPKNVTVNDTEYTLKKGIVFRDKILIANNTAEDRIYIGTKTSNFLFIMLCTMFIACIMYAVYNLIRFIIPLLNLPN